MAIKAAELQVVIGADTNPAVQGIRGAMGLIGQTAATALGVFSGVLMTQAVSALGGLASAGVQAVGEFERMEATLATLVKRDLANTGQSLELVGEKTRDLLNWVQQLAKESPFDASGVTVALRTAMAYGFTADEAQRLTKATIDYAAGSGQSAEVMNQVALALGQIRAKGKLAGQEMLQLVNAGIDVRSALQKALGVDGAALAKMLEKGMIDANTAIEAVVSTLENDFGGAAKEQSQTVSGLLSTFDELKKMGLRELFAGIVEAVRPLAAAFLDWMQEEGLARLREVGNLIGDLAAKVVNVVMAFTDAGAFSIEFSEALGGISPRLREIWNSLSPLIQQGLAWITENSETVRGALMGIAVAFGALAIIGTITGLVSALANPITLIIALAGLLGAAWANNWGGIREKTAPVLEWLRTAFNTVSLWLSQHIPVALTTLQNIWTSIWSAITGVVNAVWPIVSAVWSAFKAAFQGDWYAFGSYLRDAWDEFWRLIKDTASRAFEFLKETFADLIEKIKNFFTKTDWGEVGRNIIDGIAKGISKAAGAVKDALLEVASNAVDTVKGFLKIKSPSRVFEREVGRNIMEGWIRGIEAMQPRLNLAMEYASAGSLNVASMPAARRIENTEIKVVVNADVNNEIDLELLARRIASRIEGARWR